MAFCRFSDAFSFSYFYHNRNIYQYRDPFVSFCSSAYGTFTGNPQLWSYPQRAKFATALSIGMLRFFAVHGSRLSITGSYAARIEFQTSIVDNHYFTSCSSALPASAGNCQLTTTTFKVRTGWMPDLPLCLQLPGETLTIRSMNHRWIRVRFANTRCPISAMTQRRFVVLESARFADQNNIRIFSRKCTIPSS